MTAPKLTTQALDRMLWLAHLRARAKSHAKRSGWADQTDNLERSLVNEMRPHFIAILRLADRALRGQVLKSCGRTMTIDSREEK